MPGHSHRVAPAFDPDRARALLSEAGYADGRALGEIVLACLDLWEDAASDVGRAARGGRRSSSTAAPPPIPRWTAAIEEHAHAYIWAWIADYPDPGGGFLEPILTLPGSTATSSSRSCWLERPRSATRTSACARTASSSGSGSASKRPWCRSRTPTAELWRRPWVTGMWANAIAISTFAEAVVRPMFPRADEADAPAEVGPVVHREGVVLGSTAEVVVTAAPSVL